MCRFFYLICIFVFGLSIEVNAEEPIVDTTEIYTYSSLLNDISVMKVSYPEIIDVDIIGKTTFGNPIPAIKLGRGKKSVLFIGSHHGREWLTSSLLMKMLESYAKGYQQLSDSTKILDDVSIWFVPMLNPEGVTIQQHGSGCFPYAIQQLLIEMNENDLSFSKWKANGIGIDLNRQYPAGWAEIKGNHSNQSYQYYKGKKPLEATEAKALVRFTYRIDPLISVSYHSSGRVLYWNYKNDKTVVNRDYNIAKKFSALTGYKLAKPPRKAVGGGFTDWFIQEFKRPGFTPEISYTVKNTNPPISVFNEEWRRNKDVGLMIATEAKKLNIK